MRRLTVGFATALVAFVVCLQAAAETGRTQSVAAPTRYDERKREANENTITIITSGLNSTSMRFADDMRSVLNDMSPGGLRVIPVIGIGGVQNLQDALFLRGVDLVVVDQDVFDKIRKRDPVMFSNLNQRMHFITKLYNSEFHALARSDVKSYTSLVGKKVNVQLKNSHTAVAAESIFATLGLKVEFTYYDDNLALQKLRDGEISAITFLTGAPRSVLENIKRDEGFHFLPLDEQSLPDRDLSGLYVTYLPSELTHEYYPNLIPSGQTVPTVANRTVLAAYAWPENTDRSKKIAKFVQKFFDNLDKFHESGRHVKWREVNVAADVAGWTRLKAAREWLDNRDNTVNAEGGEMKVAFDRFVEVYAKIAGGKAFTVSERQALFLQFKTIWDAQRIKRASQ